MEWINVTDRLPENEDYVAIITTEYPHPVTGWYSKHDGEWIVSRGEFDSIGETFFQSETITGWFPLPKPKETE